MKEDDLGNKLPNSAEHKNFFHCIKVASGIVASAERSFSMLRFIKKYLHSTIGQNRLSSLTSLFKETDISEKLDNSSIIDHLQMFDEFLLISFIDICYHCYYY